MEFKELLDLHERLESRINAYWTYWSVAIFAIAGWLFSGKQTLILDQKIGIALGAAVFFFANLGVLLPCTRLAASVRDEIRLQAQNIPFTSKKLSLAFAEDGFKFRYTLTLLLHVAVDIIVLWHIFAHKSIPEPTDNKIITFFLFQ
ncbi:hypothetical protein J5069_00265 [Candidatus Symbiopectobacterium sp. NZEC127]|uniref:hypothetical protein n=1 Tax=Candidatus Symbiopectobacterium sp. NZEC127 TaxID=2820472 RepID=UPI002226E3EB|nr:hypothetical protein [Candidatus Symbiopectobacterium sp. NZEC127]MCW2484321.1 hypothetical protein [Candidatus Symbiopectobacterium sp. NZEC127]